MLCCGIALSGCAVTQDVLQAGYDNRLEHECLKTHPSNPDSIHVPQVCKAIQDGSYRSKTEVKNDIEDKKGWE